MAGYVHCGCGSEKISRPPYQAQQSHIMCMGPHIRMTRLSVVDTHFCHLVKHVSSTLGPQDQSCAPINLNEENEQQHLQMCVDNHRTTCWP